MTVTTWGADFCSSKGESNIKTAAAERSASAERSVMGERAENSVIRSSCIFGTTTPMNAVSVTNARTRLESP